MSDKPNEQLILTDGSHAAVADAADFFNTFSKDQSLVFDVLMPDSNSGGSSVQQAVLATEEHKQSYSFCSLRELLSEPETKLSAAVFKAAHLANWLKPLKFCPSCGSALDLRLTKELKASCSCGFSSYPRLQPCVIVGIRHQDKLLLAKNARAKRDFYSLIAGFVEPGETLEEAVRRETYEETGLALTQLKYLGSQPWPFPMNLMIGFEAQTESTTLTLEAAELSDADFFDAENLPNLPPTGTIARRIVDHLLFNQPW